MWCSPVMCNRQILEWYHVMCNPCVTVWYSNSWHFTLQCCCQTGTMKCWYHVICSSCCLFWHGTNISINAQMWTNMIDLRNAQMPFHTQISTNAQLPFHTQISTNAQMNQCRKQQMPFHLPKMHKCTNLQKIDYIHMAFKHRCTSIYICHSPCMHKLSKDNITTQSNNKGVTTRFFFFFFLYTKRETSHRSGTTKCRSANIDTCPITCTWYTELHLQQNKSWYHYT